MNDIKNFKEKLINDYFSSIDLDKIDPSQIMEDLKDRLGEKPAVKLNYRNEVLILEDGKSKRNIEELESVTVVFTYEQLITNDNGELVNQIYPSIKTILVK